VGLSVFWGVCLPLDAFSILAQAPWLSCFASLACIPLCIMLMQMWKVMMVASLMLLTARVFSQKDCQHAEDCQRTDSAFALIASTLLMNTQVPGVFRIPGRGVFGNGIGPWGHVVIEEDSAVLVDVPYYSEELAQEIQKHAPKGLKYILLTHDDFVGMSHYAEWKKAFGGQPLCVAHLADARGMDIELGGPGPWEVGNFEVYHVPGHSAGSVFFMHRDLSAVFTGDSFGDFYGPTGFPSHCRFGRDRQAANLRSFAKKVDFARHILPSHGQPMFFKDQQERLQSFEQAASGLESSWR